MHLFAGACEARVVAEGVERGTAVEPGLVEKTVVDGGLERRQRLLAIAVAEEELGAELGEERALARRAPRRVHPIVEELALDRPGTTVLQVARIGEGEGLVREGVRCEAGEDARVLRRIVPPERESDPRQPVSDLRGGLGRHLPELGVDGLPLAEQRSCSDDLVLEDELEEWLDPDRELRVRDAFFDRARLEQDASGVLERVHVARREVDATTNERRSGGDVSVTEATHSERDVCLGERRREGDGSLRARDGGLARRRGVGLGARLAAESER